jgi:NADH dehydrogenase
MAPPDKRIVIVGGGFAGLYAAKHLARQPVAVTLVDRKNHHTFQPLLYQVATAVLSPGEIAAPLRRILNRSPNTEVILGEVTGFDTAARTVKLAGPAGDAELPYDVLIVAAGARHSYFGHDDWAADAPGLKTVEDAVAIRRRVLLAFELAERRAYLTGNRETPSFAVVGGGPTGVELAGAIADIARRAMARDFKAIDTTAARVTVYEGAPRVLGAYPESLSRSAESQLRELGVTVRTGSIVSAVEPGRLQVGDEWIPADVILWATGVAASPLGRLLAAATGAETGVQIDVQIDKAGRVQVAPDLSLPGHPEIFVLGDMAALVDAAGKAVPGLGAAATQEGVATARNIARDLAGKPRVPFTYRDKGSMATIGRHRAIAEIGRWHFTGTLAWLMWALIHVVLLIGFRNRLMVMSEWAWAYLTRERSARLITDLADDPQPPSVSPPKGP